LRKKPGDWVTAPATFFTDIEVQCKMSLDKGGKKDYGNDEDHTKITKGKMTDDWNLQRR
jgi:hypothetical protein